MAYFNSLYFAAYTRDLGTLLSAFCIVRVSWTVGTPESDLYLNKYLTANFCLLTWLPTNCENDSVFTISFDYLAYLRLLKLYDFCLYYSNFYTCFYTGFETMYYSVLFRVDGEKVLLCKYQFSRKRKGRQMSGWPKRLFMNPYRLDPDDLNFMSWIRMLRG